jgi:hypothetical protein
MPVQGTPVAPKNSEEISPEEVRQFLRDYSGMNPLLDDVEFSKEECEVALSRAVDLSNVLARPTSWTVSKFPNRYVLLIGATSHLLRSESFRQLRNQATYQDGNMQPIGIDDKQSLYASLGAALRNEFEQLVTTMKVSQNMQAWSNLRSPLYSRYS